MRLGRYTTLATSANLLHGPSITGGASFPRRRHYSLNSQVDVGFRYFYNLDRRITKGKSVRYNSGNYISLITQYNSPTVARWGNEMIQPQIDNSNVALQFFWGYQRTLSSRFYADISGGVQKVIYWNNPVRADPRPQLAFKLRIGYTLTK